MSHSYCAVRFWNLLSGNLPDYHCTASDIHNPSSNIANWPEWTAQSQLDILFLMLAGIAGILIVELAANRIDHLLNPLVWRVEKRYAYVQERNRLRTMNGHP